LNPYYNWRDLVWVTQVTNLSYAYSHFYITCLEPQLLTTSSCAFYSTAAGTPQIVSWTDFSWKGKIRRFRVAFNFLKLKTKKKQTKHSQCVPQLTSRPLCSGRRAYRPCFPRWRRLSCRQRRFNAPRTRSKIRICRPKIKRSGVQFSKTDSTSTRCISAKLTKSTTTTKTTSSGF